MPNGPLNRDTEDELGEKLYVRIQRIQPDVAGKITGMMLESMEADELREVMKNDALLKERIQEAMQMLNGSGGKENGNKNGSDAEIVALQEELREAEQWAEDMQKEWDEKENSWRREKAELVRRIEESEERAKRAAKDASASRTGAPKNGSESKAVLEAQVRLREVEAQKAKGDLELQNLQERVRDLEGDLEKARASANSAETDAESAKAKAEKALKKKKELEEADEKGHEEVEVARKWCDEMVQNFQGQLADKKREMEKMQGAMKELQAKVDAAEKSKTDKSKQEAGDREAEAAAQEAAEAATVTSDLRKKLQEVEVSVASEKQRAMEAERKAREAEAELEAEMQRKKADKSQGKAERCRELQQDLENANRELKGYKAQLKQRSDLEREARAAREERIRAEKELNDAQTEIAELRKKLRGAGIPVETPTKKAKQMPAPAAASTPKETVAEDKECSTSHVNEDVQIDGGDDAAEDDDEPEEEVECTPQVRTSPSAPAMLESSSNSKQGSTPVSRSVSSGHTKSKAQPTAAGKAASKKKGGGSASTASSVSSPARPKSRCSNFSGAHLVAGSLVVVVVIQAVLLVTEGMFGEPAWSP